MTQTTLNSISRLQHKAIRVMTNSTYNANTEPLFYSNNILPLRQAKPSEQATFYTFY